MLSGVDRLGRPACTHPILGKLLERERDDMGRVSLEMRNLLHQSVKVVAEQAPAGVRASDESEETGRARK